MASRSQIRFTPERCAEIVQHVRSGVFRYLAAELVGIASRTLDVWVAKGRDNLDTIEREMEAAELGQAAEQATRVNAYGAFLLELLAAEAAAERQVLGVIHVLATRCKDPAVKLRAATWYLERKNNLRYGRGALRIRVEDDEDQADPTDLILDRLSTIEQRVTGTGGGRTH